MVVIASILIVSCDGETLKTKVTKNNAIDIPTHIPKETNAGSVLFESYIGINGGTCNLTKLNDGVYLITSYDQAPYQIYGNSYLCDFEKVCKIPTAEGSERFGFSKLMNTGSKYYFMFKVFENNKSEEYTEKYVEADLETGLVTSVKKLEIPRDALAIEPIPVKDNLHTKPDEKSMPALTEDEIASRTGITPKIVQDQGGEIKQGLESSVSAIESGDFVIVLRKNITIHDDGQSVDFDIVNAYRRDTWQKLWELDKGCRDFGVFGSLLFIDGGGIIDITSGKSVGGYDRISIVGVDGNKLFMFAQKGGKPKLVVLNIDKIDELKN